MNWSDITISQFEQLQKVEQLQLDEYKKAMLVCQTIFKDVEFAFDMPYKEFERYVAQLSFLSNMPKAKGEVRKSYKVGSYDLVCTNKIDAFTTAQYIDYQQHLKDKAPLNVMLSAVLVPKGKSYNTCYDIADLQTALLEMPIVDAMNIAFFLHKRALKYTRTLLNSSIRKAMWMMIKMAWEEWWQSRHKKRG